MTEPKTREEIQKEARERSAKIAEKKRQSKLKSGYKFYIYYTESMGSATGHKMYFRQLKSAQMWFNNHPLPKQRIFTVAEDKLVFEKTGVK